MTKKLTPAQLANKRYMDIEPPPGFSELECRTSAAPECVKYRAEKFQAHMEYANLQAEEHAIENAKRIEASHFGELVYLRDTLLPLIKNALSEATFESTRLARQKLQSKVEDTIYKYEIELSIASVVEKLSALRRQFETDLLLSQGLEFAERQTKFTSNGVNSLETANLIRENHKEERDEWLRAKANELELLGTSQRELASTTLKAYLEHIADPLCEHPSFKKCVLKTVKRALKQ
jgi:hypothetical protein